MKDTSKYLSLLAKVMRNKSLPGEGQGREKYNKLYFMIHSDFNNKLQKSMYPHTSDIIQKTEDMLDSLEPLYLCPEIVGKGCLLVSSHVTTNIFDIFNSVFDNQEIVIGLKKIYTQIPIVIVDTDGPDDIEILNYANIRISLSLNELKFLIIESGRKKIAINKIVQQIIIRTKLKNPSLCFIVDNIYSDAEKMYKRAVSKRFVYIDEEGVKSISKRKVGRNDSLIMENELFVNVRNNPIFSKYNIITLGEAIKCIDEEVSPMIYGFWEEYISIKTQILDYYDTQLRLSKNTLQDVVGDIVRIGDSQDRTLQSIRTFEENKEKKLKAEKESISDSLTNIESLIAEICIDLGENYITGKIVARNTIDDIFEAIFRCNELSGVLGKKLLAKLYSYGYDNYDLVSAYVQHNTGVETAFGTVNIENYEWEKAKMLISILDIEKIPSQRLKLYIRALGSRCISGKELYAKSLISSEDSQIEILQESLSKGYEQAGQRLYAMYKRKHSGVNLQTLANALVPEACMILANQQMNRYQNKRHFADLADSEFTYYKIAAANQYIPAIGKIVDIVFESRFSSGFQIPISERGDEKYVEMIENGQVLCQLCNFLISKMYNVNHYNEILGVVLFSLNENLSGAMSLLTNAHSALAWYCKGNMYEFGGGVAVDLNQAIKCYEESLNKEYSQRVEKRLAVCRGKKARYEREIASSNYYNSTRSYNSSSRYVSSSTVDDGCFAPNTKIMMADGTFSFVENIKKNDVVLAFDHYLGKIVEERIIGNVHEISGEKVFDVISLIFEDNVKIEIVKSHALFDVSEKRYILVDDSNVENFVGHSFATIVDSHIVSKKLIEYVVEQKKTRYYMPISRQHLNVFAEGILTMPPTVVTVNMFPIMDDMRYDLSLVNECGLTEYDAVKDIITETEYNNLPCRYLSAVLEGKKASISDFIYAINLFREQL